MKAFSDCDEVEKLNRVKVVVISLLLALLVIISLSPISTLIDPRLFKFLSYSWVFVFAAFDFYGWIAWHKKVYLGSAVVSVLLGIWLAIG